MARVDPKKIEVGCRVIVEHPMTGDEFEVEIKELFGLRGYFKGVLTKDAHIEGNETLAAGSSWGGKVSEISEYVRPNWTPEMVEFAKSSNRTYERHCEMYWDDLVGELAGRFGLEDDEAEELMNSQEAEG